MKEINVLLYGLGPIGLEVFKSCTRSNNITVIGGVDIDPNKVEKDLGEIAGLSNTGIKVTSSLSNIPHGANHSVALHTTGSSVPQVWPQIKSLLDHGYSVVSSCEELSFPWVRYPELAKEIDQYAKDKGLFVIGTGVNPGFVMDSLAVFTSAVTRDIESIHISRKVDVSKRRIPLQQKVGVGKTVEEFNALAEENNIGHVGLEESLRLILNGLGLSQEKIKKSIKPTVTSTDLELSSGHVGKGRVSGLHETAVSSGTIPITLDLVMSVNVEEIDRIIFESKDLGHLEFTIPGGLFGDTVTANVLVNVAQSLMFYRQQGLRTMTDIHTVRNILDYEKLS
ncbi:hypothetical protein [Shouchella rhizosphaerae]|uniref:2,4-diaminopentanoate dehydrogenase C-terminal domain-containing protein n=1 Tax=Shouchella rhizosphaerae TaxID=866786 RepID=A0ABZ2CQT2_9BACI|nr:hypothetical protein [Shouchella rhizosphaerae]MCM3311833.1 hypothetical protein [Psychrobacillus sp. MER TA 17]SHL64865.1 4-hydroxy-tetrahydrodipicolinate reductase [Shouchella rhizosphaerae]